MENPSNQLTLLIQNAMKANKISSQQEVTVEPCANPIFGDYTSNIAMQLHPTITDNSWASPKQLAQALVSWMQSQPDSGNLFESISVAGPGFINFTLSQSYFTRYLQSFHDKNSEFSTKKTEKLAIVEYSSPNIAKPFTIGHLRSTIIGDSLARLLTATGYQVHRDNHLGDWGTQFGKLIVAIKELGKGNESENIAVISQASQPVIELVKLYVEFHEKAEQDPSLEEKGRNWFTKLEKKDPEARALWQRCVDWSWLEFERIYQQLEVSFTENDGRGYGESFFEDKMASVIKELESHPEYFKTGENGAKLFFFPNEELPPLMILKKDGSTLYATRDLATDKFRKDTYGSQVLIVNEVGAEQELYFRQIYRIEELLGWFAPKSRVHVKHGLYRFKTGKMSTRKGNVIWLEDVLQEAHTRAQALAKTKTISDASLHAIAIGALKWNDLKRSSQLDIAFDWDEILSMTGNSGPYIQYTAVRCKSVLDKASATTAYNDVQWLPAERSVVRELLYWNDVVDRAANEFSPHHLCTYLFTLAGAFNSFYNGQRILGDPEHESKRIALTQAVYTVLEHGLGLLGMKIPLEM